MWVITSHNLAPASCSTTCLGRISGPVCGETPWVGGKKSYEELLRGKLHAHSKRTQISLLAVTSLFEVFFKLLMKWSSIFALCLCKHFLHQVSTFPLCCAALSSPPCRCKFSQWSCKVALLHITQAVGKTMLALELTDMGASPSEHTHTHIHTCRKD